MTKRELEWKRQRAHSSGSLKASDMATLASAAGNGILNGSGTFNTARRAGGQYAPGYVAMPNSPDVWFWGGLAPAGSRGRRGRMAQLGAYSNPQDAWANAVGGPEQTAPAGEKGQMAPAQAKKGEDLTAGPSGRQAGATRRTSRFVTERTDPDGTVTQSYQSNRFGGFVVKKDKYSGKKVDTYVFGGAEADPKRREELAKGWAKLQKGTMTPEEKQKFFKQFPSLNPDAPKGGVSKTVPKRGPDGKPILKTPGVQETGPDGKPVFNKDLTPKWKTKPVYETEQVEVATYGPGTSAQQVADWAKRDQFFKDHMGYQRKDTPVDDGWETFDGDPRMEGKIAPDGTPYTQKDQDDAMKRQSEAFENQAREAWVDKESSRPREGRPYAEAVRATNSAIDAATQAVKAETAASQQRAAETRARTARFKQEQAAKNKETEDFIAQMRKKIPRQSDYGGGMTQRARDFMARRRAWMHGTQGGEPNTGVYVPPDAVGRPGPGVRAADRLSRLVADEDDRLYRPPTISELGQMANTVKARRFIDDFKTRHGINSGSADLADPLQHAYRDVLAPVDAARRQAAEENVYKRLILGHTGPRGAAQAAKGGRASRGKLSGRKG